MGVYIFQITSKLSYVYEFDVSSVLQYSVAVVRVGKASVSNDDGHKARVPAPGSET